MRFTDEVVIVVRGGVGGHGSSAVRMLSPGRRQFDGGDGGDGGAIYFEGSTNLNTLSSLATSRLVVAESGVAGQSKRCHGRNGRATIILVPLGTTVTDLDQNQVVCDVVALHQRYLVARGGIGGIGNAHAFRQAASYLRIGSCGQYRRIRCELKLLADVGLVGWPNAGKSSLLTAISNQRCRVGAFAFSTLTPNLGLVKMKTKKYVVADLPGLIPGSHTGKGLGIDFLKHVERCLVLAVVLDGSIHAQPTPLIALKKLKYELNCFNKKLITKPIVIVLSKSDLSPAPINIATLARCFPHPVMVIAVSATKRHNLDYLQTVLGQLQEQKKSKDKKTIITKQNGYFDACLRFTDFVIKKIMFNRWWITFKARPHLTLTNNANLNRMLQTINNSVVVIQLRGQGIKPGHQVLMYQYHFVWQNNQLIATS